MTAEAWPARLPIVFAAFGFMARFQIGNTRDDRFSVPVANAAGVPTTAYESPFEAKRIRNRIDQVLQVTRSDTVMKFIFRKA